MARHKDRGKRARLVQWLLLRDRVALDSPLSPFKCLGFFNFYRLAGSQCAPQASLKPERPHSVGRLNYIDRPPTRFACAIEPAVRIRVGHELDCMTRGRYAGGNDLRVMGRRPLLRCSPRCTCLHSRISRPCRHDAIVHSQQV